MKSKKFVVLCNEKAIQDVAKDLGVHRSIVQEVVNFQSNFTKKIMESGTFDSIRWPYFGVFKVNIKRTQIVNHLQGLEPAQKKQFKKDIKDGKIYKDFKSSTTEE